MKRLIICLSSYSPSNNNWLEKYNRQELYSIALWNLIQTSSNDTDICIVENTTTENKIENDKLKFILTNPKIKYKVFLNQNDLGSKNKGAGELQMCKGVLNDLGEKLNQYDWVIYYTSRHIIYNIQSIESKTNKKDFDILIGNPSYILPNGKILPVAEGNYNDMLFAMKAPLFVEYCSKINPEKLVREKMNSERYLFLFIEEKLKQNFSIDNLTEIPLVRYDYAIKEMHLVSNEIKSYSNFDHILKIYSDFYTSFSQKVANIDHAKKKTVIISESKFKKNISKLFGQIIFTKNEYKYNIEPTWEILCKQILNKVKIDLPQEIETTKIYQNRIDNLNKIIWK